MDVQFIHDHDFEEDNIHLQLADCGVTICPLAREG